MSYGGNRNMYNGFDPFEEMDRQFREMERNMNAAFSHMEQTFNTGFFRNPMMPNLFNDPFIHQPQHQFPQIAGFERNRRYNNMNNIFPQPHHHTRPQAQAQAPIIEEVSDDHINGRMVERDCHVEEPDEEQEEENTNEVEYEERNVNQPRFNNNNNNMHNTNQMYSYSSSFSSNPIGRSYTTTTTETRIGPGGVRETHSTYENRNTGEKKIVIERGIGDRSRRITRNLTGDGQEQTNDLLRNIGSDEASEFDREWSQRAQRHLPQNQRNGRIAFNNSNWHHN